MLKRFIVVLFFIVGFIFVFPTSIYAVNYYVSTNGADTNNGLSISTPFRSLRKAAGILRAGDTVFVRGGTYNIPNNEPIQTGASGTANSYITYKNYNNETPILQGNYPGRYDGVYSGIDVTGKSYIVIEGFTIQGFRAGLSCKAPGHHVVFRNNELRYNSESGISITNKTSGTQEACDYVTIEANKIHDNGYYLNGQVATGEVEGWGSGISINAHTNPYSYDSNPGFHNFIRGNLIYHNYDGTGGNGDPPSLENDHTDGNGIIFDMTADMKPTLVENNIIFNNGGRGIHPLGAKNIWIVGNTLYHNHFDPYQKNLSAKGEIIGRDYVNSSNVTYPLDNIHVINNIVIPRPTENTSRGTVNYFGILMNTNSTNFSRINSNTRNNIWYGGISNSSSPRGSNYSTANPNLVNPSEDPSSANFKPQTISTNVIEKGSTNFSGATNLQVVDFEGNSRPYPQGGIFDIGAFEFQANPPSTQVPLPPTNTPTSIPPTATSIPTSTPIPSPTITCPRKLQGDANCDGLINTLDFQIWKDEYLKLISSTTADFSSDNPPVVNNLDFQIWKDNFILNK